MKIGLVRRGFSRTGGAENYLRRFAETAIQKGHECVLFSAEWPREEWPHDELISLTAKSPRAFADALTAIRPERHCDFLFSLERVGSCDAYRAGDGVHLAWLERRARFEPRWKPWIRTLQPKHRELLALERSLFSTENTPLVIANSHLVKREIIACYDYPESQIHVVHNGIQPLTANAGARENIRAQLGLSETDYVVIFVGSGWERKGLRFAIDAINRAQKVNPILLVAGRGNPRTMPRSERTRFVGPVRPINDWLAASDCFILPTIYDPFSNACIEALASGLPVITTSANGFSEIIRDGIEGSIVENPDDIAALARSIELWGSAEKRAIAKPQLLALAAQYSIAANVEKILSLISNR